MARHTPGGVTLQRSTLSTAPIDWREERLRYQVLRFIYDRVAGDCDTSLSGGEVQGALALAADDVQRVVGWLETRKYVRTSGSRPSICLTAQAIEYLENAARRRQSLRT